MHFNFKEDHAPGPKTPSNYSKPRPTIQTVLSSTMQCSSAVSTQKGVKLVKKFGAEKGLRLKSRNKEFKEGGNPSNGGGSTAFTRAQIFTTEARMPIEPQSCTNKTKENLLILKNFQPSKKLSNSTVATPKFIKFRQSKVDLNNKTQEAALNGSMMQKQKDSREGSLLFSSEDQQNAEMSTTINITT